MRTVYVIGIGAGDPEQLTLQAVAAMNRVDVFFTVDKGPDKADLAALRDTLLARHVTRPHRVVTIADPPRRRVPVDDPGYPDAIASWRAARSAAYRDAIGSAPEPVGGFLVWGDPALYDGTLGMLDGLDLEVVAVPGISAVQALAAAHRTALHRTGRPFTVTTGRRLAADGMPAGVDDVVVMLDAHHAFADLPDPDLDILWGAYLGTPDEVLVAGDLHEVKDEILATGSAARAAKGWIMDTYLLRRRLR